MGVLTAKRHKGSFWMKEMFYICGFVEVTVYTFAKIHQIIQK